MNLGIILDVTYHRGKKMTDLHAIVLIDGQMQIIKPKITSESLYVVGEVINVKKEIRSDNYIAMPLASIPCEQLEEAKQLKSILSNRIKENMAKLNQAKESMNEPSDIIYTLKKQLKIFKLKHLIMKGNILLENLIKQIFLANIQLKKEKVKIRK